MMHLPQQTPQRAERSSQTSAGGRTLRTGYSMHLPLLAHHRHWDTGSRQHSVTGAQQQRELATAKGHHHLLPKTRYHSAATECTVVTGVFLVCTRRGRRRQCRFLEQVKMLRTLQLGGNGSNHQILCICPAHHFWDKKKAFETSHSELMSRRGLCVPSLVFPSQTTCSSFALSSPGGSNASVQFCLFIPILAASAVKSDSSLLISEIRQQKLAGNRNSSHIPVPQHPLTARQAA